MRPLQRLLRLGRPVRGRFALALLAGAAAAGAAIGLAATSAWLLSRAAEQPPVLYLLVAVVAVRAFGIGRGVLRYAERLASHDAAFRVLNELRARAYARLERLSPAGLTGYRSGDLLARLVADVDSLADIWLRLLLPYAVAAVAAGGAAVLVFLLVPAAGLALAGTLLFAAVAAPLLAGAVARGAERRIAPARGRLAASALTLLQGAPELSVAGAAGRHLESLARLDGDVRRAEARAAAGTGVGVLVTGLAGGAAVWLALVFGVGAVRAESLAAVLLATVVLVPIAAHEVVAGLAPAAQQAPRLRVVATRVEDVLQRPDPVAATADPLPLPTGPYGLRVRGLRARYRAGGPDVLRGLDFFLRPGERAVITGPSGSGKSTLAAVLLRLLDPAAGTVELVGSDGAVDLTRLVEDDARRVIGLCAQDVHVFDTTIAENVRLARPAALPGEVREALRRAGLLDWVETLPQGTETPVGEHGARLSGGQRQRLGLARVLLAGWPVVVFDEPTEHLDEPAARALTADLLAATAGRTALFITHRPELMAALSPAVTVELGAPPPAR
jgi:thiol reductant ABC exporter CydC subunit